MDPSPSTLRGLPPVDRFWMRVDRDGPLPTWAPFLGRCWLWTGAPASNGYGRLTVDGRAVGAHRFSYEIHNGSVPDGLQVDHLCRVLLCVRPDHLEAVTPGENTLRSMNLAAENARKTHCSHGHRYDERNTHWVRTPTGVGRVCRACGRDRAARRWAEATAA